MPTINVEGVAANVGVGGPESVTAEMIKAKAVEEGKIFSTPWEPVENRNAAISAETTLEARIFGQARVEMRGSFLVKAEEELGEGAIIFELPKSVYEHGAEVEPEHTFFCPGYKTVWSEFVILVSNNKVYAAITVPETTEVRVDGITYALVEYTP